MVQPAVKQRIEYIDLAKGFCILLVVASHILAYYRTALPYDSVMKCFRMPLYFFLSGVFFKQYESFFGFFKRKVNKLLIPFAFFYLTLGIVVPAILYKYGVKLLAYDPRMGIGEQLLQFWELEKFPNAPIWFLLCLFEVNMLFYVIFMVARRMRWHATYLIAAMSVACGVAGMLMSYHRVLLPCYFDTALTSMPFFAMGYILNRKTRVMQRGWRGDKYLWLVVVMSVLLLMWLAYPLDYRSNYFAGCYFTAHLCGVVGTLMTLFIAKMLKHIPLITYWGRYSIMILCTHQLVYQLLEMWLKSFVPRGWWRIGTCMTLTMMVYVLLIPVMRKLLPHVTAQRNVIKV
ncbi:MAG: acyltransferase family protein [Muribaculaceae bacterium]